MAKSSVIESFDLQRGSSLSDDDKREVLEDFYWLRFLELEQAEASRNIGSVSCKKMDKMGQSIFTVTKRLRKEEENEEFGFEDNIVWTKPCVVGKLIKDSPAERCHIEAGDLIIFIDKKNVVDLNKQEILNLINKSEALTLEVFRRAHIKVNPYLSPTNNIATTKQQRSTKNEDSIESITIVENNNVKLASKSSIESKRKLLVTFSKEESTTTSCSIDSQRSNKLLSNLVHCERQFVESLNFGYNRYLLSLKNRKDLLSSKEHEVLFKSIEEIKIIMENICKRNGSECLVDSYKKNLGSFINVYESYFATIKIAESIIVEKTHHPEFIKFIANPSIPSHQPIFHNFIQTPLEYFNSLIRNFKIMLSQCRIDSNEYKDLNHIINQLQLAYSEAMSKAIDVEVKPLLATLESRLVFTKCKPFKLDISGRQWIFGGDLTRVEGNLNKPTYTLLFNDIILFSTINRDRVMFITEEPIYLKSVVESFFNIKKKESEFRLTIETNPNYKETSPTTNCTPDLMSPLRQSKRRNIFLRAPSEEIKKVWQNFITQQVFNVNSISPNSNNHNHDQPPIVSLLLKNPSTQTDNFTNVSTNNRIETENICSPNRRNHVYEQSNNHQLNLKAQKAFDMGDSLPDDVDYTHLKTPETPSCANLSSLNGKIQQSLSTFTFSSRNANSECGESCDDIFNDFDSSDISFSNDVKECMFMQNDPFFADDEE